MASSKSMTDSTLQETSRSTDWETLYLCGGICRCQSGSLVEDGSDNVDMVLPGGRPIYAAEAEVYKLDYIASE